MVLNISDKLTNIVPDNGDSIPGPEPFERERISTAIGHFGLAAARTMIELVVPVIEDLLDRVSSTSTDKVNSNPRRYS